MISANSLGESGAEIPGVEKKEEIGSAVSAAGYNQLLFLVVILRASMISGTDINGSVPYGTGGWL